MVTMDKSFSIPISRRSFMKLAGLAAVGTAAGIAAAWGLSNGVEANAIRWENIPKNERSYVSEGDTSQSYIK